MSIMRLDPPPYQMEEKADGEYVSARDALILIYALRAIATADYTKVSQAALGNLARRALAQVGE
jgi:hypothetical protein